VRLRLTPPLWCAQGASCELERQEVRVLAEANRDLVAQLAAALPITPASDVRARATAAMPPAVQKLEALPVVGMKMPDSPNPVWLRPGKDGKCHNPVTGEDIHHVVLRGACWEVVKRLPNTLCPGRWYDPPPEVMNDTDPKNADLKDSCFIPYALEGRAVDPNTP